MFKKVIHNFLKKEKEAQIKNDAIKINKKKTFTTTIKRIRKR